VSARRQAGIALIMVLVVLVALALIATPFALSMRGLESSALQGFAVEAARADARSALDAVARHLQGTDPLLDGTPHVDTLDELAPGDLPARLPTLLARDPHGTLASVRVADEQGKLDLATASPWLLGNLLGGRTHLTADVGPTDDTLPVAGTRGFADAGRLWAGREALEYSASATLELREVRRGVASAALPGSGAESHRAGDELLDLRLLLLVLHGRQAGGPRFTGFARVDGLKDVALDGEVAFTSAELERVRPWLTAHAGPPRFGWRQRVLGAATGRDGWPELRVPDGRLCGPGALLELRSADGRREWLLVLAALDWGGEWRLSLLEPPALPLQDAEVLLLLRTPVNVNTCAPEVLAALLAGVGRSPTADVITPAEADALAQALPGLNPLARDEEAVRALRPLVESGACSEADVRAALAELLARDLAPTEVRASQAQALLAGVAARRGSQRVPVTTAATLAARLRGAGPASHEQLRAALDAAVGEGLITLVQRDALLRNALDPGDARITGGTAPFTYASGGTFSIHAAASRNLANGKEQARAQVREVLTPAPEGEGATRLVSQRDLLGADAHAAGGWITFPEALAAARPEPGSAAPPDADLVVPPAPESTELEARAEELARVWGVRLQPDRAGGLLDGRPGPAEEAAGSFAAPAPVRSALAGTLHFDESGAGVQGQGPRGWDTRLDGPLLLPLAGLKPALTGSRGLLRGFAVEFWFELHDVDAETVLLDLGLAELEDRVLLALVDRQLLLRVEDTAVKDFEARMPAGRAPPGAEIRYAFDDGLPLRPGVPYHVAALVGGARDRDLALFVDGIPRGQRAFTTALAEDLPSDTGAGIAGYRSTSKVKVLSTAGFPQRGALRIGHEIVEYVGTEEGAFLVRPEADGDPFGGRGRRGTLALDHPASELVELHGWVAPLASTRASTGDSRLGSALGAWGLAEMDPTRLADEISMSLVSTTGTAVELVIGTGLTASGTTIPVRATGSVPLEQGTFSSGGGHAILFCDYGGGVVTDATISVPGAIYELGATTTNGVLGGAEVVRYSAFDGTQLTGVLRNQAGIPVAVGGQPSDLATSAQPVAVTGGSVDWAQAREYVTTFDAALTGAIQGLPLNPRVLVIPLSVDVSGANLYEDFHPNANQDAGTLLPDEGPLLQVDLDFGAGDDSTEWVRWNTATSSELVRDDADAVTGMLQQAIVLKLWDPGQSGVGPDELDALNDALDFRGQSGTRSNRHAAGAEALPTQLLGGWNIPDWDAPTGLPGRHDFITLASPEGDKEWHRINWATADDEEWSPRYAVLGLRDAVLGEFVQTDESDDDNYAAEDLGLDKLFASDQSAENVVRRLNVDTRRLTRLLCPPSGELPAGPLQAFHAGADWSGRVPDGSALIDELRLHVAPVPGAFLPGTGRYVLAEELEFDEQSVLRLGVEDLQFPHVRRHDVVLGADALEILSQWPQAGGLLLLGEEIIGYAGLDPVDSGHVFIAQRGLYGTARAYHRAGETTQPLLFWPASPLSAGLGADGARVPLADATGFPERGLLLVGDELLGWEGVDDGDLLQPVRRGSGRLQQEGLLRGRFGTQPAFHATGTLARWFPERQRDAALLGEDAPEGEALVLRLPAPGAVFTELSVVALLPDAAVGLDLRVVPDELCSPHADPAAEPLLRAFSDDGSGGEVRLGGPLFLAADALDLWLCARWRPGAFDPRAGTANGWKLAPEVVSVMAGHVRPTLVHEHEEGR